MRPKVIDTLPLPAAMWHLSEAGYDLIKRFESCRLKVYKDVGGNDTIGWGHRTDKDGLTSIRPDQAEALLKLDGLRAIACLRAHVKRSLFQNEVDALASLVFNIGCEAFSISHLLMAINRRDNVEIEKQWLEWDHVNGKRVKGLTARRSAEYALWCVVPF